MPLDSRFLGFLCKELNAALCNCHIEKIHCPAGGEFVFSVKKQKLYISLLSSPFITLCNNDFINPDRPPMFCMLLRKYLQNGKITQILQPVDDRVVKISVQKRDELGGLTENSLYFEMLCGGNLILCSNEGKIIDAYRRLSLEDDRLIMPGATYEPPKKALDLSPLILREAQHQNRPAKDFLSDPIPVVLVDGEGKMKDISYTKITQYGDYYKNKIYDSFTAAVNDFYVEKRRLLTLENQKRELNKTVKNLILRNRKKLLLRKEEKEKANNREQLRIKGELLKANLYKVQKGQESITVENFYDNLNPVKIALKPHFSPQKNAEEYFKEYKKECNAAALLDSLIEECERYLSYLYSVEEELMRAANKNDIDEITQELALSGIISKKRAPQKAKTPTVQSEIFKDFKIIYGKNNRQNEEVTLRLAQKSDLWLHAKNVPGSHVVIKAENRKIPDEVIEHAAKTALKNSGAAKSQSGEVDYTFIKNVKKPQGAKCAHVIYKNYNTMFVKL